MNLPAHAPVRRQRLVVPSCAGAVLLLVALVCLAYRPALSGPFLLDDGSNLPQTRIETFDPGRIYAIATDNDSGLLGRPVAILSFSLNYLLGGDGPHGFKLVNLLLHCLNIALVYGLCRAVLLAGVPGADGADRARTIRIAALIATALWALHPLQLSTVMYVVQRMALLSATFTLLALTLYLRMRRIQLEGGRPAPGHAPLIALATVLACFSKENGALIPVHLLLLEILLFRFRMPAAGGERRRFVVCFGMLIALPLAAGVVYFATHAGQLLSGYAIRDFDAGERLLTQVSVVGMYLKMILLPNLADMTFYHDDIAVVRALDAGLLVSAVPLALVCVAVPLFARRAPVLSAGLALFVVSHLLESTVLPLELAFEHRNYFALLGLALAAGWVSAATFRGIRARALVLPGTLAVVGVLALQTHARALDWSSDMALHASAVRDAPGSLRARTNLAILLADRGELDGAKDLLEESIRRHPDDAYAPLLLARRLSLVDALDERGIAETERALAAGVLNEYVAALLARMHMDRREGRVPYPGAREMLRLHDAALGSPRRRLVPRNEAVLHMLRAELLTDAGRRTEAVAALREAAGLVPDDDRTGRLLAERLRTVAAAE